MDTIEPAISAQLLEHDDGTGAVQVLPPVVAVVVTSDPGPWLENALLALAGQDYPALSVLVLDAGSTDDPTPRIAAAMPGAFVRRRAAGTADGVGFAAAANEVLESVEGAMFLLFCHDDVTPDGDAVRLMVEEAYRSNAGIVGPKLVDDEHPEILLEVGMSVDHYGVPFSGIEPDEVDQEQHDAVRDVFFVSNAAMLVRTDLFHELSGFDPATFPGADDVDLCWRARLAGARVIVAPAARVRHRRSTANEVRPTAELEPQDVRAKTRTRVRVLCKTYSALSLVWVLPTAFILGLAEMLGLAATGRARRSAALLGGWVSAFAHPRELLRARGETQRLRRVDDGDVRDLMIRGSARVRAFITQRVHVERLAVVSSRTRIRMERTARQLRRAPAIVATVLAVLVLFGSRSLLFGRVPEVGGFQSWPGVGTAWATFTSSWRPTFMGSEHAATPAFGLISVLDALLLGHAGLARSLVVGGALPLGAWGAYRLVRPFAASALPGMAAAIAYAANPVVRNAIWRGELGPLVCFALAPFVLRAFVRSVDEDADRRIRPHAVLTVALLVAVCASVWPPAFALALLIGIACFLTTPFTRDIGTARRALPLAAAATAVGVLLCTPWVWSLLGADGATFGLQPRQPLSLVAVLHFDTGRAGAGLAPWGILAAAAVPLAIATGGRLAWATRAWMLAAASFALAWLPGRLSPDALVPAPEGVLVGAAVGLAFACGLGVAAVLDDLRTFGFGWRQVMTVVATVGIAWSMLGLAADTLSGRFGLEVEDWASTYSWMSTNPPAGGFRVLWIGDPAVLPGGDAKRAGTTGFMMTRDGPSDTRALWAGPEGRADRVVARAIEAATSGTTSRLGHLLAPAGVRYVAFVTRAAPTSGVRGTPQPRVADALARQLDLTLSRVESTSAVYENDAWLPMHALVPTSESGVRIDTRDPFAGALRIEPAGVQGVPTSGARTREIGPGTLLWSEAASKHWRATSAGHALARRDAFGMTNAFAVERNASVAVHYHGGAIGRMLRGLQVLLWAGVVVAWFVTRRRVHANAA